MAGRFVLTIPSQGGPTPPLQAHTWAGPPTELLQCLGPHLPATDEEAGADLCQEAEVALPTSQEARADTGPDQGLGPDPSGDKGGPGAAAGVSRQGGGKTHPENTSRPGELRDLKRSQYIFVTLPVSGGGGL